MLVLCFLIKSSNGVEPDFSLGSRDRNELNEKMIHTPANNIKGGKKFMDGGNQMEWRIWMNGRVLQMITMD